MRTKKATLSGWPVLVEKELSGGRFGSRGGFRPSFGLDGYFLALQVGVAAFPLLALIVLFAHMLLYIPNTFRLFEAS